MSIFQSVTGSLLAVLLLTMAGLLGWRQWQNLRRPPGEDDAYLRPQAWRRLVASFMMVVLAGLLVGAMVWLEAPAQQLADQTEATSAEQWTPEQRSLARGYGWYWITFLLVLLAWVSLAGVDVWATYTYRLRKLRELEEERRDLLRDMAARVRRDRLESN